MKNEIPVGVYSFGGFGGLEVYRVDTYEDVVSFRYLNSDGSRSRLLQSKIRFARGDRPYFMAARSRVYLDEVTRIGSPWIGGRVA